MKLSLDYSVVKNNVLNNVLPYIEHIETKEIMMNIITMDMARDMNGFHKWTNTILLGSGLVLVGTAPIISLLGITGATAIGLSIVNLFNIRKENKTFHEFKFTMIAFLQIGRQISTTEFEETMDNITSEDMIEFLENSAYMNLK